MSLNTKVSGTWRTIAETFVKVSGTWRPCKDVFIKVSGVWRSTLYQSGTQNFTSTGTFTIPAGVYSLNVQMVGGGGGGGNGTETGNGGGGGGGGGGGYIQGTLSVTPFTTFTVTHIGAAGGNRAAGGYSRFYYNGLEYIAYGGGAGATTGGLGVGGGSGGIEGLGAPAAVQRCSMGAFFRFFAFLFFWPYV